MQLQTFQQKISIVSFGEDTKVPCQGSCSIDRGCKSRKTARFFVHLRNRQSLKQKILVKIISLSAQMLYQKMDQLSKQTVQEKL